MDGLVLAPDLDDGGPFALGRGVEEPRSVPGFNVVDGLLVMTFEVDRPVRAAGIDAGPDRDRLIGTVVVNHFDLIQRDGSISDCYAQTPEAAFVTGDRDDVFIEPDEAGCLGAQQQPTLIVFAAFAVGPEASRAHTVRRPRSAPVR